LRAVDLEVDRRLPIRIAERLKSSTGSERVPGHAPGADHDDRRESRRDEVAENLKLLCLSGMRDW
jgi:hypothetical protein